MKTISNHEFQQILNTTTDLVFIINYPQFRVTFANAAAEEFCVQQLHTRSQLQNAPIQEICSNHFVDIDGSRVEFGYFIANLKKFSLPKDLPVYQQSHSDPIFTLRITDLTDRAPQRLVLFLRLIKYQVIVKRNRRNVNLFIHSIGHELKQPLGLIQAYSYYLQKFIAKHNLDVQEYPQKINSQISVLVQMLNDIVDTSKMSMNGLTITPKVVALDELLIKIVSELQTAHQHRSIELKYRDSVKAQLDPIRFRQVIMNLVNNAMKYSQPTTPVVITLKKNRKTVRISVTDQGLGIHKKDLPYIFDAYYRSKHTNDSKKGLGLGLALVKEIVDQHKGKIRVVSELKKGSTFSILLPVLK